MGTWRDRSPPLLAVELVCRRGLLFEQFAWPRCRATLQFYKFWGGEKYTHPGRGKDMPSWTPAALRMSNVRCYQSPDGCRDHLGIARRVVDSLDLVRVVHPIPHMQRTA